MKTLLTVVITISSLLVGTLPTVSADYADEEVQLRAVTPLPGGYVQLEYATDSKAQADLFILYKVLWQGWTDQTDTELQGRSLKDDVGVIAVDPPAIAECLSFGAVHKPCRGWRYVYVVHRTPTQTCQSSECQEPQESFPFHP